MNKYILLIALIALHLSGYSQKSFQTTDPVQKGQTLLSKTHVYTNDVALVKPMINTNDSNGGYYSEYYLSSFQFLNCGSVVKNFGTSPSTHVYLEMKLTDYFNTVLATYYSDTLSQLNPGEQHTLLIPEQITLQQWLYNFNNKLIFKVKSDQIDENPINNADTVPRTDFYDWSWTNLSRSIYPNSVLNIGQSPGIHSGDFLGFRFSFTTNWHWLAYLALYLPEEVPTTVGMTAKVYCANRLIDTAQFNMLIQNPPEWIYSNMFAGYEDILYPDSVYYVGVEFTYPVGSSFKISTDTAVYHNFSAETVARIGGNWTTLNFIPVMKLICDPEGIPEKKYVGPKVFPNPAKGTLFVDNVMGSIVEIYDLAGKLLLTDNRSGASRKLDITSLTSGVYLIRIINNGSVDCRKFVVN